MKPNRFWLPILSAIVLLSILALFLIQHFQKEGDVVNIYQGGVLLHTLPLHMDQTLRISSENGSYNLVAIENGQVQVIEASCPDQVCVHHGPTSITADPISCLPNKLTIQVVLSGDAPLDGVSQ